jgi:co-chaperonin GroES (HSP10)
MNIKPPKDHLIISKCYKDSFKTFGVANSDISIHLIDEDDADNYEVGIVIEYAMSLETQLNNSFVAALKKGLKVYIKKDKAKWMEIDGKELCLISIFDICAINLDIGFLDKNINAKEKFDIFDPKVLGCNFIITNVQDAKDDEDSYFSYIKYGEIIAQGDGIVKDRIGNIVLFNEASSFLLPANGKRYHIVHGRHVLHKNKRGK